MKFTQLILEWAVVVFLIEDDLKNYKKVTGKYSNLSLSLS